MSKKDIQILQNMPIFGGIREDILQGLLDASHSIKVNEGDFFFRECEHGDYLCVLTKGRVAVLKEWKKHSYLIAYLNKGDCFGEMELIDLQVRSASVLAVENCSAIKITVKDMYTIYQKDHEQYAMIHMNMGREVTRRLRETDNLLFQTRVEADLIDGQFVFKSKNSN